MTGSKEERGQLRGTLFRGDGAGVVELLAGRPWPADALQLIGEGLLVALGQKVDGSSLLATECVAALRARDWAGDEELAELLQSHVGSAPARLLRPLTIDLEDLANVLEGDPAYGGGRIDLRTGEVWPQEVIENWDDVGDESEDFDDPDRWLWVHCEGSRDGYRDMEQFIADLDQPDVADRLDIAISGRGAFRRFKDVLSRWPDLMERWFGFADERQRGRARSWLANQGYAAVPRENSASVG